jgi:hypothetical protein
MTKPMTDEWQTIFLNAGTEKGLGDLSMMIGVVSEIIAQATSKAREEALDDMFLEIAKLAVPDERQPSAGDLHVNMDDIHEIRKSLKKDK